MLLPTSNIFQLDLIQHCCVLTVLITFLHLPVHQLWPPSPRPSEAVSCLADAQRSASGKRGSARLPRFNQRTMGEWMRIN